MRYLLYLSIFFLSFIWLIACQIKKEETLPGPLFHFVPDAAISGNPAGVFNSNDSLKIFYPSDQNFRLTWKSATSTDQVNWIDLPGLIQGCDEVPINNPKRLLTGTIFPDPLNRSGFCSTPECLLFLQPAWPCEIDPAESIRPMQMSADYGITWIKVGRKVTIDEDLGRIKDPKIFFHDPTQKWIMLATTDQKVHFLESSDLLNWKHLSMFGPAGNTNLQWENPELIQVPSEDKPGAGSWLLSITSGHPEKPGFSAVQYFLGQFDGTSFFSETDIQKTKLLDYGRDFIAAFRVQTELRMDILNEPMIIGKIGNNLYGDDLPDKRFHGMLSLFRRLTVRGTGEDLSLVQRPGLDFKNAEAELTNDINALSGAIHARLELKINSSGFGKRGIHLLKTAGQKLEVGYDPQTNSIYIDRSECGFTGFHPEFDGIDRFVLNQHPPEVNLIVFLDRNITEVFLADGTAVITSLIFPKDLYGKAEWFGPSEGNSLKAQIIR